MPAYIPGRRIKNKIKILGPTGLFSKIQCKPNCRNIRAAPLDHLSSILSVLSLSEGRRVSRWCPSSLARRGTISKSVLCVTCRAPVTGQNRYCLRELQSLPASLSVCLISHRWPCPSDPKSGFLWDEAVPWGRRCLGLGLWGQAASA